MSGGIFKSPSKKRDGIINVGSPTSNGMGSPTRMNGSPRTSRGILLNVTPRKNGRAGLISPAKRSNTDLDRSARKRAGKMNYSKLMDGDDDMEDEDEDEEMSLADRIIQASKQDGGTPVAYEIDMEDTTASMKAEDSRIVFDEDDDDEDEPYIEEVPVTATPTKSRVSPFIKKEKSKVTPKAQPKIKIKQEVSLFKQKDFIPTPVPKDEDDFLLKQKKFDDRPLFLDGFEGYFEQHKTKVKTSGNTLAQLASLEYEEYARNIKLVDLFHKKSKQNFIQLHKKMFNQWYYELLQGFNLCFYGVGSKRDFLLEFTSDFLLPKLPETKCCVINGYNTEITLKEVFWNIVPAIYPNYEENHLSKNVREALSTLLRLMPSNNRPFMDLTTPPKLVLLIHNLDGKQVREESFQNMLTSIAQLNCVWVIASIDNVNTPLMWDSSKLSKYSFIWHELTTFQNYNVENSFKDILSLGKSTKFSGSKGAKYVLSSLTANAKSLYRILLSNQLTIMEEDPDLIKKPDLRGSLVGSIKFALELKNLYQLCAEEFVVSNDVSFRTMLHEFVEHNMCNLVKDNSGTEMVFVPFKMDEMEKLLEEELLD